MNVEIKDFVAIYRDITPDGYCQHMISEFDRLKAEGAGTNRFDHEKALPHFKNDHAMFLENGLSQSFKDFDGANVLRYFYDATQLSFNDYASRFSVLKEAAISGHAAKFQKTDPGGGYHVWHGEHAGGLNAGRVLAYMLYLNTLELEEGGETEFLYQRLRIRPEENTMIVWPAAFTHAHRGNTVLGSQAKYVITGWFYYA